MATFYFDAAVDNDWQTIGNWWMAYNAGTSTHSVPATALPTSADNVEVRGAIASNSGSAPTVANAAFFGGSYIEAVSITITGDCTFNDSSYNYGTITGDCTFNDSSYNYGTITGDCTFNGTFNDSSYNYGSITGDCTFNYSSSIEYGTITGDCTFNDNSGNSGTITGDCTFNDNSGNGGDVNNAVFNDSATLYRSDGYDIWAGRVAGNCTLSVASAALSLDGWGVKIGQASYNGFDRVEGTIEIKYDKGINGSSILGVV